MTARLFSEYEIILQEISSAMIVRIIKILLLFMMISGCASFPGKTPPDEIQVLFCGDVMLDWGIKEITLSEGYDYPLERVRGFLRSFDYRICNLECPIASSGTPHPDKKYIFIAPAEAVRVLKHGGITGVSLANNHSTDFGIPALQSTMTILAENGIQYTGAGADFEESRQPVLLERHGISAAVLGYTNIGNKDAYATKTMPGIARANLEIIKKDILNLKKFNDIVVISLHWGDEYADYPADEQIELAHAIIEAGADAVIGHHSHIYQGIEIYRGRPVIYSLGNFLFGSLNEDIRDNIVVSLRLGNKGIRSIEVYPLNGINDPNNRFQPRKMTGSEAEALLLHLREISHPLGSEFPRKAVISNSRMTYTFAPETAP